MASKGGHLPWNPSDLGHLTAHPHRCLHSPVLVDCSISPVDEMAIDVGDRPRPLRLQPLMVPTDSDTTFVNTPIWSAAPLSSFPRPEVLLPDSADEDRVSEIDQRALLNLRSFQSQLFSYSASDGFTPTSSSTPSSAGSYERRHTLTSPSTPFNTGIDGTIPPDFVSQFARRRSAPFSGRRATPEAGMIMVVPQQLSRPPRPAMIAPDSEMWWPIQAGGEVKIHVGVMTRRGQAERLTRCFPLSRLQQSARTPSPPGTPHGSMDAGQNVTPGSVLPIPGEPGMPLGRRFSTGWSPASPASPRAVGRRRSHLDFPVQLISKSHKTEQKYTTNLLRQGTSGEVSLSSQRHHHADKASHTSRRANPHADAVPQRVARHDRVHPLGQPRASLGDGEEQSFAPGRASLILTFLAFSLFCS